jgi:hypothetical protein
MQYLADEGTDIYSARGGNDRKIFDAMELLASMYSHVPNRGESWFIIMDFNAAVRMVILASMLN